jgi:hypothetical protein
MRLFLASALVPLALVGCDQSVDAPAANLTQSQLVIPSDLTLDIEKMPNRMLDISITGAQPGEEILILRGEAAFGDGDCSPALGGDCLDITGNIRVAARGTADASGNVDIMGQIPAGAASGLERTYQAVAVRNGTDAVSSNPERILASDGNVRLRAVHASPDAPPVDIYANGGILLDNVPFGAASGWLTVPADTYTVEIRAAGAPASSAPVFSADLPLMGDIDYTVVATGFLGSTDPADSFRVVPLVENWGNIDTESLRVNIVHASPDAPAVAIDVGNDGTLDVPSLATFAETGAAGIPLPAETALAAGIRLPTGDGVTAFSLPPLPKGGEVTVIAIGELAGHPSFDTGFGLLALFRDGTSARILQDPVVYALHASPGAPAVDILAGGAPLATDVAFRELSGAIQVPPGMYDLDINVAGTDTTVDTFTTPMLEAGQRYLATATGVVGGAVPFQLVYTVDDFRDDDQSRVQIVHASPDAPAVDIGGIAGQNFFPALFDVPFRAQTGAGGIAVAPGTYDLGIAVAGDPTPLFTFSGVGIPDMFRGIFLATGSVGAGEFGVTVVDTSALP